MVGARGRRRGRAHSGGFTLLEVMFATAVLLLSMLSAVSSQLAALSLIRTTRENNIATAELTAAMEEVTALAIDDIPIASSAFADGQPVARYTNRALRNELVVGTYPGFAAGVVPDPLTIVLTMTWTDWAGRPAQMSAATMKAR